MSGSENSYQKRNPSTGCHLLALDPGPLESILYARAVGQGHHAAVPPRRKQRKALLPEDFRWTRGSPLATESGSRKVVEQQQSPKRIASYKRPTSFSTSGVLQMFTNYSVRNHVQR